MLHVLPAGTYGLRPAVNRSNTRTRCGTVYIGGRVHRDAGRIPFQPLGPFCPLTHARDPLHRSSQELHHQVITSTSSHVYPRWCHQRRTPMHSPRSRSFPKPLRPVTAHHRRAEFSKKFARLMFRRFASPRTSTSPSVISVFGPSRRYPHRLSCTAEQYPASFGLFPEKP